MTDLLFEVAETKERMSHINHDIAQMDHGNNDFSTCLSPMMGKIEMRLHEALDLFFEQVTGLEGIASHMLYETGVIHSDGIEYRLTNRNEFNSFIFMESGKKKSNDILEKKSCEEMLEKQKSESGK